MKAKELDRTDRKILRLLQQEGRISFTELGERVGLSTTPCTERVRRLERDGVITGYHARLAPTMVKASLLVFVEISLSYKSGVIFEEFRRAALKLPNVLECHLVSGDFDYLIKARISENRCSNRASLRRSAVLDRDDNRTTGIALARTPVTAIYASPLRY